MTKLSYDEWKRRVDMELVKLCTMTSDDIDDWYYSDDYRAGRTPLATAKRAYRNAERKAARRACDQNLRNPNIVL